MKKHAMALALISGLWTTSALAQLEPAAGPCPGYKSGEIDRHMAKALSAETPDLPQGLIPGLFILPRTFGLCAPKGVPPFMMEQGVLPPTKAFDQLYFIGSKSVGVWILKTKNGLVMFDAMNNEGDSRNVIEPGMRQLGLKPEDVRYIVVTHGHFDHWGGARYFQDRYGSKVLVGAGDEATIQLEPLRGLVAPPPPKIDELVQDGRELRLGGASIKLYLTPGHTLGTLSAIFEVTDRGKPHRVGLFGGYGLPPQLDAGPSWPPRHAGLNAYISSVERFTTLGKVAGVDVGISTHPFFDDTIQKIEKQRRGVSANPWVMGKDGWLRFSRANLETAKAVAIMEREHPITESY